MKIKYQDLIVDMDVEFRASGKLIRGTVVKITNQMFISVKAHNGEVWNVPHFLLRKSQKSSLQSRLM